MRRVGRYVYSFRLPTTMDGLLGLGDLTGYSADIEHLVHDLESARWPDDDLEAMAEDARAAMRQLLSTLP